MLCQHCNQRSKPAQVVGDRRGANNQPKSRELLCLACSRDPSVDVVVGPLDFADVLASDVCWCKASLHAGVALRWCPRHGQLITTERTNNPKE